MSAERMCADGCRSEHPLFLSSILVSSRAENEEDPLGCLMNPICVFPSLMLLGGDATEEPLIFGAEVLGLKEFGVGHLLGQITEVQIPKSLFPFVSVQSKSWRRMRGPTTPTWARGPLWHPSGSSWRNGKEPGARK